MSRKERERLTVMVGVTDQKLTLVQASELMRVCYRQSKRIWRRYQADGDAGLVHRLRGKPSARRKPSALRTQVLALYAEERYADFGPTLMAEHLAQEKLVVDHETLRRWRLAEGTHPVRRRKQKHRAPRVPHPGHIRLSRCHPLRADPTAFSSALLQAKRRRRISGAG